MRILKTASEPDVLASPDILSAYVESLALHRARHGEAMPKDLVTMIDRLPSRGFITTQMDDIERDLLLETVGHIWRKVTGGSIREADTTVPSMDQSLNGCYWMVPGGVLVAGLNHFSGAAKNRNLLCSLLDINNFVFEGKANSKDPNALVRLILEHGGIRVHIDRQASEVYMQCTEESWPWAREKLKRMYHLKKVAKVLDRKQPYLGWRSGVPVIIN